MAKIWLQHLTHIFNVIKHIKPWDLQVSVNLRVLYLLQTPNRGGTLRITAGAYRLIWLAYTQRKRMRLYLMCLCHKMCGSASSKIPGSGQMGATHHFVTGNLYSLTTMSIGIVWLLYLKMQGSGMTWNAVPDATLFVMGVSWCSCKIYLCVKKV